MNEIQQSYSIELVNKDDGRKLSLENKATFGFLHIITLRLRFANNILFEKFINDFWKDLSIKMFPSNNMD